MEVVFTLSGNGVLRCLLLYDCNFFHDFLYRFCFVIVYSTCHGLNQWHSMTTDFTFGTSLRQKKFTQQFPAERLKIWYDGNSTMKEL